MIYYVAANASRNGCGTKEKPFQTISEAAGIACAGDEVLVAPGIYREYVNPKTAVPTKTAALYTAQKNRWPLS